MAFSAMFRAIGFCFLIATQFSETAQEILHTQQKKDHTQIGTGKVLSFEFFFFDVEPF
jgi:hypothetical protein